MTDGIEEERELLYLVFEMSFGCCSLLMCLLGLAKSCSIGLQKARGQIYIEKSEYSLISEHSLLPAKKHNILK